MSVKEMELVSLFLFLSHGGGIFFLSFTAVRKEQNNEPSNVHELSLFSCLARSVGYTAVDIKKKA